MKKIFYFIIAFWLGASSIAAQPAYCGDGDGTEANPCEISTAEQLFALAAAVNTIANVSQGKYYKLVNDIDLSDYTAGEGWIPIGKNNDGYHFRGNFDGNGKVISNLTIIGENYQGLFGRTSGATIKNVIINNCNIRGLQSVGGLVGFAPGTIITNCHATGKVEGTDEVGGLLGYGNSSPVTDCTADCTVTGSLGTGGLVGNYLHSTLTNCSASGNVNGYNIVGGLVGFLCSAYMTGCFATGNVNGDENVGGLVGSGNVPITNSHATGNVSGNNRVGGLVGSNGSSTLTNCYATGTVNGENEVGGLVGYNSNTPLVNCYATGDVVGSENVGGLLGECFDSSTTNCHATGNVSGNNNIGGLVGNNNNSAAISNCYATGNVTGTNDVGGLVGWNTDYSTIENCYAAGTVNGNGAVGGLVGYSDASSISNCYAIGNVTGTGDRVGGLVGYCQLNSSISNCYAVGDVSGVIGNVGGLVGLCQFGSSITNSYAFNCKVEHAGTDVGRITGNSAGTLTNNYAHEQMELWANGTQITPTPNPNGKDGDDLTYLDAINPATYVGVFDSPWTFDYLNFNVSPNTNLPILSAFIPSAFPNAVQSPQIKKCNVEPLFCGGSGTEEDPYQICTAKDLADLAEMVNTIPDVSQGVYYIVVNDLDLKDYTADEGWIPIGSDAINHYFRGNFDGNGKVITNLVINRPTGNFQGLFGYTTVGATIKNLGIENCNITGSVEVGGLVGRSLASFIINCYATGNVTGTGGITGGLVGTLVGSYLTNCYVSGNVTGIDLVGGLTGLISDDSSEINHITNCYAISEVIGNDMVGGLVGLNGAGSSTIDSYACGNVTGNNWVGGLMGATLINANSIENCYAFNCKVEATAETNVGRIIGGGLITAANLINNHAHEQMELWENGVQITPTPNSDGKDGANVSIEQATTESQFPTQAWLTGESPAWTFNYANYNIEEGTNLPILSAFIPSAFPNAVQSPQIKKCNVEPLFCGGSGTIADPYLICTAEQLDSVRVFLDAHYKLANDINLTTFLSVGYPGYNDGKGWEPIGDAEDRFTGSLNGDGHRIIGLWINRTGDYIGLFGFIDGAVIRNVGLIISD